MVKKRVIESVTSTDMKSRRWKTLFASARLAYDAGELRQAESLLARARELAHELPEHSFAVHATEIGSAAVFIAKKKPRDAASRLRKPISTLESNPDPAHKELLGVALRFHAEALAEMGDYNEAEKELKRSVMILEEVGVDAAVQLGYSLCDLAGLYLIQSRISESHEFINSAMDILFSALGPESPEYTRADMIYTVCMFSDSPERSEVAADGIQRMEYMYGINHPNIHRAIDRYLKVLAEKGDETRLAAAKERFAVKASAHRFSR